MTRAEMTEIFAVLMLAYPNAEMFKAPSKQALMEKLAPTITLWATCLTDVDFWTGQQAAVRVCRVCKFPPTIAEFREQADAVTRETRVEIETAYLMARSAFCLKKYTERSREEILESLPPRSKKVIEAMGGIDAFIPPGGHLFDMRGFEETYERLLRKNPVGLPGGGKKQLKD